MKKLRPEYEAWKNSEDPSERRSRAKATGDWEALKNDKYWYNRIGYAEATGDWAYLLHDEAQFIRDLVKEYLAMFEEI